MRTVVEAIKISRGGGGGGDDDDDDDDDDDAGWMQVKNVS